jgi:hypothetical protein
VSCCGCCHKTKLVDTELYYIISACALASLSLRSFAALAMAAVVSTKDTSKDVASDSPSVVWAGVSGGGVSLIAFELIMSLTLVLIY